ncbi:uncharacterized protein IWZ02DRAFT_49837 [Phyllosticta citriasiana]|uniref:uncharacterized protein n=1 Tax=Phyllosticta citriasiana TaxID=595635 RepID=UPI0030FD6606
MLTTGHALLILTLTASGGKSVQLDTDSEARPATVKHPSPQRASKPASKQASKQASTRVSPFRPAFILCLLFLSISFLRPYSFASGQRTTFAPSALLASPSPTRIQLASLRRPSVSVRSLPPSTPRPPTTRRPSTT